MVDFLEHFEELEDPRQHAKVLYPLDEVLLLALLGVLAGCESWVEIARYWEKKLDLLRRLRPYCEGTAWHDQLGEIVAVDGKTLRRSYQQGGAKAPIHMISAWSARQNLVLGQAKVADKSNEIVAIPELLGLLAIEGATVTIDAMGCQREIAGKIIDQKADYLLGLKGNRGTLRADVELLFTEQAARDFADISVTRHQTVEKSHGRVETRSVTATHDIDWLNKTHRWPGLQSIVRVETIRELGIQADAKIERETRFYIASSTAEAEVLYYTQKDELAMVA